ncbi:YLR382Cp-like protein [Nadsonia fulvescens var. elongata DSM 6958]|uniref:leucine--tRNA ligase n=1 Tax=Nadsonia fulvescens var. elongata DSM 6958 TaxID=857566 RepID=A0A1E3PFH9_9ASCO|nr:YLR382Cp-like protein [Nadsonia fulvescens var. elongata DSM 6958]
MTQDSKIGYKMKDFVLSNPLNPTRFDIPVFVAPYVISDYGSGCVMGCPGHDERDHEFWSLNAPKEEIKVVVSPKVSIEGALFTGKDGFLNDSCGRFSGLSSAEGGKKIVDELLANGYGKHAVEWRIRDWLISRQRFWGAPIPMVHCKSCGIVPVPDADLPVLLPKTNNLSSSGNPLALDKEFVHTKCPSCGGGAHRDTDTMDTFMDSSWYFFRYTDPKNQKEIFSYDAASALMPVDIYIGGVEHAILHLLYARFISKFLASQGLWSGGDLSGEPIRRLITQGMVHGKTYNDADTGRFLKPEERDINDPSNPKSILTGKPAVITYEKMSKSKYNGSDPGECISKHGADATRAHIIFQAPVSDVLSWDESKIVGIERWLAKVIALGDSLCAEIITSKGEILTPINKKHLTTEELDLWNSIQSQITLITNSMEDVYSMNTSISNYMILTNTIITAQKSRNISGNIVLESYERLIKLMAPVTPSTAEECWEKILKSSGKEWTSVFTQSWPRAEKMRESADVKFNVFVNGKMKFVFSGTKELYEDQSKVFDLICATEEGRKFILGRAIKKVIVPPGRAVISFVLG